MTNKNESRFKRVETKYLVPEDIYQDFLKDLMENMKEDKYPHSTISNIYYDTADFQIIQDSLAKKNKREKIRVRYYDAHPTSKSLAFLEIKEKDEEGVGHKLRLASTGENITGLLGDGLSFAGMDAEVGMNIRKLRDRYPGIGPSMYIYYDRYSLKERKNIEGHDYQKIRITFDRNLIFRDYDLESIEQKKGEALLPDQAVLMEIKAPGQKPDWLQSLLDQYGILQVKFSKYAAAYHVSHGLDYELRPIQREGVLG